MDIMSAKELEGALHSPSPRSGSGRSKSRSFLAIIAAAMAGCLALMGVLASSADAATPSATAVQQADLSVTVTVTDSGLTPNGGLQLRLPDLPRVFGTGYVGCKADASGNLTNLTGDGNCTINTGSAYTQSTIRYEFDDLSGNLTDGPWTVTVVPYVAPTTTPPSSSTPPPPPAMVYVCKYVGKPGVNERLKSGQNPIKVAASSVPQPVKVGSYFADAQGRSYVLALDTGQPAPSRSDCPSADSGPTVTASVPSESPTHRPGNSSSHGVGTAFMTGPNNNGGGSAIGGPVGETSDGSGSSGVLVSILVMLALGGGGLVFLKRPHGRPARP